MHSATVTSLPPGVQAVPKGELLCALGNFKWAAPGKPPRTPYAIVHWWGQQEEGVSLPVSNAESVSFPVCCGPKYIVRYLRDCGVLRLVLVELMADQELGHVQVPVNVLDINNPVVGSFPVITTGGQRVASLDVHLEILYNAAASSFELNEHMASLMANKGMVQPGVVTTWGPPPYDTTQGATAVLPVLEHMDVSEILHVSISRNFQAFHNVFKIWHSGGRAQRSLADLVKLLQAYRVLRVGLRPDQLTYLETVLDPAGDLSMTIDDLLAAIRQAQDAGLRVRSQQLEEVLPGLTEIAKVLQSRLHELEAVLLTSSADGTPGAMMLRQLMSWVQQHAIGMDRQLLRYVCVLLAHMAEVPGCIIQLQDVKAFIELVFQWAGHPLSGVSDVADDTSSVGDNAQQPAASKQGIAAEEEKLKVAALQRLKNRIARPTRTAVLPAHTTVLRAADQDTSAPATALQAVGMTHVTQPVPSQVQWPPVQSLETAGHMPMLPVHPAPAPRFLELGQRQALQAASPIRIDVSHPQIHAVDELGSAPPPMPPVVSMEAPVPKTESASHDEISSLQHMVRMAQQLQQSLDDALQKDVDRAALPNQPLLRAVMGGVHAASSESPVRPVPFHPIAKQCTGLAMKQAVTSPGSVGAHDDDARSDSSGSDAAAYTEQQLLQQLFFGGQQTHGAHASPANTDNAVNPSAHSSPHQISAVRSLQATLAATDVSPVQGMAKTLFPDSALQTSPGSPGDTHTTGQDAEASITFTPARSPGVLAPSPAPTHSQPHAPKQHLTVQLHSLTLAGVSPGTALLAKIRASCCAGHYSQLLNLPSTPHASSSPLVQCDLDASTPATPLTAAAAVAVVEIWLAAGGQGPEQLQGVATVPLSLAPDGSATAEGVFPLVDVLGFTSASGEVGQVKVCVSIERVLVRHVWRVTVCGVVGLPSESNMESAGMPLPAARYAKYCYPGEAGALYTEDVPPTRAPIFAATAMHSVVLPGGHPPTPAILTGHHDETVTYLSFEVWDRWADGPDTCVGAAQLPLSELTRLQPGAPLLLSLPLVLDPLGCETHALVPGTATPVIQIRLQAEQVVVGPATLDDAPGSPSSHGGYAHDESADAASPPTRSSPSPGATSIVMPATIMVDIAAGCGLQTAVAEAAAWLGGAASVLGRAHQLGPHPYATLSLFPGDELLMSRYPPLRTPFQAQAFCPQWSWHGEVALGLDLATLAAICQGSACIEVWHHPSRSLAALAAQQLGDDAAFVIGGVQAANRDVLLGTGTIPLSKLLLKPQGTQQWVTIKSMRGEPVAAVRVSLAFSQVNGVRLDSCTTAPSLSQQVQLLGQVLQETCASLPKPLSPDMALISALANGQQLPPGLHGQWCRCTLYIEQAQIPLASNGPGATTSAARHGSKVYKYYVTYRLPGCETEVTTADHPAAANNSTGVRGSSPMSLVIPLQHVGVHWVAGNGRLVGALSRLPLILSLWRAHERQSSMQGASPAPAGSWLSTTLLGQVELDLSPLLLPSTRTTDGQTVQARWVSGTHMMVDPGGRAFMFARIRVKVLLELAPPTTPPPSTLLYDIGQELDITVAQHTDSQHTDSHSAQQSALQPTSPAAESPGAPAESPAGQREHSTSPAAHSHSRHVLLAHASSAPAQGLPGTFMSSPGTGRASQLDDIFSITRSAARLEGPAASPTATDVPDTAFAVHPALQNSSPAVAPVLQEHPAPGTLDTVASDTQTPISPAERLQMQLQELDVLRCQWHSWLEAPQRDEDGMMNSNATQATPDTLQVLLPTTSPSASTAAVPLAPAALQAQPVADPATVPAAALKPQGLFLSTVRMLEQQTGTVAGPARARVTTCSDDGAGDMYVMGAESPSEADTDELLASIPVAEVPHAQHGSSDRAPCSSIRLITRAQPSAAEHDPYDMFSISRGPQVKRSAPSPVLHPAMGVAIPVATGASPAVITPVPAPPQATHPQGPQPLSRGLQARLDEMLLDFKSHISGARAPQPAGSGGDCQGSGSTSDNEGLPEGVVRVAHAARHEPSFANSLPAIQPDFKLDFSS